MNDKSENRSNSKNLVPNACHEDWDKLTPEARGHHCEVCATKVWDLSAMTEGEAQAFLAANEGDLCVSYKQKSDGGVEYLPESFVPLRRLARRLPAAAGLTLALAACGPTDKPAAEPVAATGAASPTAATGAAAATAATGAAAATAATGAAAPTGVAAPTAATGAAAPTAATGAAAATGAIKPEDHRGHVKGKFAPPKPAVDKPIRKGKVKRPEPDPL